MNDWDPILQAESEMGYFKELTRNLIIERSEYEVYPPKGETFNAFRYCPLSKTKVVILGQDPYIKPGQAHGLAFSVNPNIPIPPSLMNIFKELQDDLGCYIPNNGCLTPWAYQGVLLLNDTLTVRRGESNSHAYMHWDEFTNHIIQTINNLDRSIVFMLWGKHAQKKEPLIDPEKHLILKAPHPSPLAGGKFFGCKHFSKCNEFLYEIYPETIDWQIPNI